MIRKIKINEDVEITASGYDFKQYKKQLVDVVIDDIIYGWNQWWEDTKDEDDSNIELCYDNISFDNDSITVFFTLEGYYTKDFSVRVPVDFSKSPNSIYSKLEDGVHEKAYKLLPYVNY